MSTSKNILVIDDDPDIIMICKTVLEHHGCQVTGAASAKEGEKAIQSNCPDLVILDVMMESPDSGFQLADTIARDFPDLPVIIFSSIAEAAQQVFDTTTLPVSAIIEKPIDAASLWAVVQKFLNKASS